MQMRNISKRLCGVAGIGLLAVVLFGVAGCESFNSASSSYLTSVTITDRPMADVKTAVTNVFVARMFTGGQSGTNQFTYKRPGSSMDNLAYGSYMFEHPITVKVVVTTRQQATNVIFVGCNAWIVEAENDPVFQESHPVHSLRKGPYEELLKAIKAQVGE
jgi:hypothetical protein